jgi:transposase
VTNNALRSSRRIETGVNLTVTAGNVAAIGDIGRFNSPQQLVSYFGLNPRVRQSGLGAAHHGRISKIGRGHARAMLVEAAWAAAKAPGPLHFVRAHPRPASDRCGGRGSQAHCALLASVDEGQDYQWARPALVANKTRAMQLQAGHPQQKGSLDSGAKCNRAMQTGFARLCQAL